MSEVFYLGFAETMLQFYFPSVQYQSPVYPTAHKLVMPQTELLWVMWNTCVQSWFVLLLPSPCSQALREHISGLLGALNTACFPSSMWMARASPSKFQILTPLPAPHQNHQVSHLPASFRLFCLFHEKYMPVPKWDDHKQHRAAILKPSWSSDWLRQNFWGGWGLRIGFSTKFPGDADKPGLGSTLWKSL